MKIKGILFVLLLVIGAVATFIALLPCVLLTPFSSFPAVHAIRQKTRLFVNECFFQYAAGLLYHYCSTAVHVHYADPNLLTDQHMFIISNHRSTIDWMFSGWCYASFFASYPCLIFMLKESLRTLPVFGYCAQIMMYVFLSRNKQQDLPHVQRMLRYLWTSRSTNEHCRDASEPQGVDPKLVRRPIPSASSPLARGLHLPDEPVDATSKAEAQHHSAMSIIMFPEGTDLSPENVVKSEQYAQDKGLKLLKHVLYPRPTGFVHCMRQLQTIKPRDSCLHDVTIAYKDRVPGVRTTHQSMIAGDFPLEVHLYVRRTAVSALPMDNEGLEQWLTHAFLDKETLLEHFYSGDMRACSEQFPLCVDNTTRTNRTNSLLHIAYMLLLIVGAGYLLWCFKWFKWVLLVYTLLFAGLAKLGGFEQLELVASGY